MRVFAMTMLMFTLACEPKPSEDLNLVVAASIGPAAEALAAAAQKKGLKINVHAGASSLIARQIVNGLNCDAVILADEEWMDYLNKEKAIESSTRKPLLSNALVWVTPMGKATSEDKRIALADPEHVPAGKYAKAALLSLGKWQEIAARVVPAPDVRTALLWVESGEVDSAIVYESDARSSTKITIRSRLESKTPIVYPLAQCRSKNPRASELYAFLNQPLTKQIFRDFGFRILNDDRI